MVGTLGPICSLALCLLEPTPAGSSGSGAARRCCSTFTGAEIQMLAARAATADVDSRSVEIKEKVWEVTGDEDVIRAGRSAMVSMVSMASMVSMVACYIFPTCAGV